MAYKCFPTTSLEHTIEKEIMKTTLEKELSNILQMKKRIKREIIKIKESITKIEKELL